MDFSNGKKMETPPRKIVEPLITIPKPRPSALHQQQMQQLQIQQQQQHQQHQNQQHQNNHSNNVNNNGNNNSASAKQHQTGASIYSELLDVIEEIGLYVRPCYLGHRASLEKVRQLITRARHLVRLCLIETDKSAYQ